MTKRGRNAPVISLTNEEIDQLESYLRSRSMPSGLSTRFRIILLAAEGFDNKEISKRVGLSRISVGKWRKRYYEKGLEGLHDELRAGRPRSVQDEKVAELIHKTLQTKPEGATHWSTRTMASEIGVSHMTVARVWQTFGLKPHLSKTFKLSTDPFFVEKVRDIVGLYLNPPENALVLCVDEKSQCQALERSQPALPLGFGYAEGYTHDYARHGTLTLFAALDVASGGVLAQSKKRHRHQEFLQFLRHIDANVPPELNVHIVMDNYATHKQQKVRSWFARRPRYHIHFIPTYSSWLNQVESWFGIITRKTIRRGSFRSTRKLAEKIDLFVKNHNKNSKPFIWTATAESIFEKLERLCKVINVTEH
jgi:putative transposase